MSAPDVTRSPPSHRAGGANTHDAPGTVMFRLAGIEEDLAVRQNEYEAAAKDYARHKRDWEKKLAMSRVVAHGGDADTRKANALLAAVASDDTYQLLREAEGAFEGCKAVIAVLNTRAMIGMAILRAQSR